MGKEQVVNKVRLETGSDGKPVLIFMQRDEQGQIVFRRDVRMTRRQLWWFYMRLTPYIWWIRVKAFVTGSPLPGDDDA